MKIIQVLKMIIMLPARLFSKTSVLAIIKDSKIHKTSAVLSGSRVYGCEVGRYTYISGGCIICNTKIGNFCSIGDNCMISPGKHPVDMVSTSPVFYSALNSLNKFFNLADFKEFDETKIGNDVWIGANAFVKGGVSIGDGAIIGTHAVVTKDISPYTIVGGNPAKMIRKRFDDETIEFLLKIKWWEREDVDLQKNGSLFTDINQFKDNYK